MNAKAIIASTIVMLFLVSSFTMIVPAVSADDVTEDRNNDDRDRQGEQQRKSAESFHISHDGEIGEKKNIRSRNIDGYPLQLLDFIDAQPRVEDAPAVQSGKRVDDNEHQRKRQKMETDVHGIFSAEAVVEKQGKHQNPVHGNVIGQQQKKDSEIPVKFLGCHFLFHTWRPPYSGDGTGFPTF